MSFLRVLAVLALSGCSPPDAGVERSAVEPYRASGPVTVSSRTSAIPTYPCSRCHGRERKADPRPRELTELHGRIVLRHGSDAGWCYRCHDQRDPDRLHLASGEPVELDASSELCGSCHGEKLADWRAGIHGLTTGHWDGPKERRACTACHDPHAPAFPRMAPLPAPPRPRGAAPAKEHP